MWNAAWSDLWPQHKCSSITVMHPWQVLSASSPKSVPTVVVVMVWGCIYMPNHNIRRFFDHLLYVYHRCEMHINNLKDKRSVLLPRARTHVAVSLIDGYKWLKCRTKVVVVQFWDVPFWTTPQWQTSNFAFLHLLLYCSDCSGTERYSTIVSDQFCNCHWRHTISLPFLPRIHEHNCRTFKGSFILVFFL